MDRLRGIGIVMMSRIRTGLGAALIAGLVFSSGAASAQNLDGLPDRLVEQINTLIALAIQTGDSKMLENGLFDLTIEVPDLAVFIAKYTVSKLPEMLSQQPSREIPQNFAVSMIVAATVGPATAVPTMFREIVAATTAVIAETPSFQEIIAGTPLAAGETEIGESAQISTLTEQITEQVLVEVEISLIKLFNDESMTIEDIEEIFPAASSDEFFASLEPDEGLVEPSTTESASPTG